MALPPALLDTFLPAELEFVAELEDVEIVPLFRMLPIRTIAGMVGPFEPPKRAKAPIWIACSLKKRRKCRIVAPAWMGVEHLEQLLKQEISQAGFSSVPFRYMEIARILLEVASDDIPFPDKVRSILKDLREARQSKSREGMEVIDAIHVEMTNISAMELNEVRPFFSLAMKRLIALDPEEQERIEDRETQEDTEYT